MQHHPPNLLRRLLWMLLLVGIMATLLIDLPVLEIAGPAVGILVVWGAAAAAIARIWPRDEVSSGLRAAASGWEPGEVGAARRRLEALELILGRLEAYLLEVRRLWEHWESPRPAQITAELLRRRDELQLAIARERVIVASVLTAQWLDRVEPLLQPAELYRDADTSSRIERLVRERVPGVAILADLAADRRVPELHAGRQLRTLLEATLAEMTRTQVELETHRAAQFLTELDGARAAARTQQRLAQLKECLRDRRGAR